MNEVLYDTGSAVVSLYDLYQLFEFPGQSPGLGGLGGGRGGGGCPWDHRAFPLLSLIFHISFNKKYSRSPA